MLVIQHNCARAYPITIAALETGLQQGAEIICTQEPLVRSEYSHPGYVLYWPEQGVRKDHRVMTAVRRDIANTYAIEARTDLINHPYFLVLDIWELAPGQARKRVRRTRIVNCYDNWLGRGRPWRGQEAHRWRALEDVDWTGVLRGRVLLAGDFNAHSTIWNPRNQTRQNAAPLEGLIEDYNLCINNDLTVATRPKKTPGESIIDLTLTTPEMGLLPTWAADNSGRTPSDHVLIVMEWTTLRKPPTETSKEVTGWQITDLLADPEALEKATKAWQNLAHTRPPLDDTCTEEDIGAEALWVQNSLTGLLNKYTKPLRVTARSKRWWGTDVKEARHQFAHTRRAWAGGQIGDEALRESRNHFYKVIRQAKRECWERYLTGPETEGTTGKDQFSPEESKRCWGALRYTTPRTSGTTPVLRGPQGQLATTLIEKEAMIRATAFPDAPDGGLGQPIPQGIMHQSITEQRVHQALFSQAVQKAPGGDRINFQALRLVWRWDAGRITALTRQCFRLGIHPGAWKIARGILLRKPNKPDYSLVKAYRVISLLNCLGKVIEKVAAEAIATYCEAAGVLHPGQMGCRRRRSTADAVACLIQETQDAWALKQLVGALFMDVKGAFDHVAPAQLTRRMEELGLDGDLIRWTQSFLEDRRVQLVIDGFQCLEQPIQAGIPQGSPVSPILFVIYLSGVFRAIEAAVPGIRGLSFVDDIGLLIAGRSVAQVATYLEQAGNAAITWGRQNAVEFDAEKTEAVLFTRQRGRLLREQVQSARLRIEGHLVIFNQEATRWLGIWLDTGLKLKAHYQTCLRKARTAEARVRTLCRQQGLSPGLVRRIQIAAVQAVALYGAELWWHGQKDRETGLQLLINRQARATIGAFRTTPIGPLLREAGLEPAGVILDHKQRTYAVRLLGLPRSHPAHQILPVTFSQGDIQAQPGEQPIEDRAWATFGNNRPRGPWSLGQQLARQVAQVLPADPSGGFEETIEAFPGTFPGVIRVLSTIKALEQAQTPWTGLQLWSDGSRLEDGRVGAAVAWQTPEGRWRTQELPMGKGQEVFDAELLGAYRALELAGKMRQQGPVRVLLDSQAAIARIQHLEPGPGQALAIKAHQMARQLRQQGREATIQWVPGHAGVEGNEQADQAAKRAASKNPRGGIGELSLAYTRRALTEARVQAKQCWLQQALVHRNLRARRSYRACGGWKQDPTAAAARKEVAGRYYQLKTGHAVVGAYLQQIKAQETAACRWCRHPYESVRHLLLECREWRTQRRTFYAALIRAKVPRPTLMEESPEGRLFSNPKATKAILTFLAATGAARPRDADESALRRAQSDNEVGLESLEEAEREGEG